MDIGIARRSSQRATPVLGVLAALVALAAGCSSTGGSAAGRLPAQAAGELAQRAERVAAALEAGACDEALAEARSLQADVAALEADPAVRAEALAGAARLVSGISCAVPAPPVTVPAEVDEGRFGGDGRGKKKGKGGGDDDD